jgi:hypothetical protein
VNLPVKRPFRTFGGQLGGRFSLQERLGIIDVIHFQNLKQPPFFTSKPVELQAKYFRTRKREIAHKRKDTMTWRRALGPLMKVVELSN